MSTKFRNILIGLTLMVLVFCLLSVYTCSGSSCFGMTSPTAAPFKNDFDAYLQGKLLKHSFSQSSLDRSRHVDLEADDVLVYLHIQKTGGATFGRHLVHNLDVQPPCECEPGVKKCECFTRNNRVWLFSRHSTGWMCGVHADWTELHDCVDEWFQENDVKSRKNRRYHYITFLRDPLPRFLSEWQHVRRGATWKAARLHCNGHEATLEEVPFCYTGEDWTDVTFEEFISCKHNLAFNRMTRMLANLTKVNCYDWSSLEPAFVNSTLLASAKENLLEFAFFGIVEEQRKTQFLFERTFGLRFIENFEQRENTHVSRIDITGEMQQRVIHANGLDVQLYQYAKDMFLQRVRAMEKKLNYTVEEYFESIRDGAVEEEEEETVDEGRMFEDPLDDEAEEAGGEFSPPRRSGPVRSSRRGESPNLRPMRTLQRRQHVEGREGS